MAELLPPDFSGETDCEDQGFSLISDGCPSHKIAFTKRQSPSNARLKDGGPWYWYCAECPGYFGEVAHGDIHRPVK